MTATLRPFRWRDLPSLYRYRSQGLCLDTALGLTRGTDLTSRVLLSYLTPATGFFTWICANECDEQPLMGQMTHAPEAAFARLTFLAPEAALASPSTDDLLEQLARQAGSRGAFNLLAEIDEQAPAFEALRQSGFAIYARQIIWQMTGTHPKPDPEIHWKAAKKKDTLGAQLLYHSVVPGLVQQVEPLLNKEANGLVCYQNGEVIAYADLKYGPRGIWVQPFIHPDVENIDVHLQDMIQRIPKHRNRPVYICVRSYQSWLKSALLSMEAEPGPSQAVMVKRLAVQKRSARFVLPNIDGQREITTPIARSEQNGSSIPTTAEQ